MLALVLVCFSVYIGYQLYALSYFSGPDFLRLKKRIKQYTNDCNDLNNHIEELKRSQSSAGAIDYGSAQLMDKSNYNFKRSQWAKTANTKHVHNCSASVCKKASEQPFKYLCKYFNIDIDEQGLGSYEGMLNDFAAAEQGKKLLVVKKGEIMASIQNDVPWLIWTLSRSRLEKSLGFEPIDLGMVYVPSYTFQYVSSGGNSSMQTTVKLDVDNLERFVGFLGDLVKFRKSVAGQRALMTQSLRELIKQRDKYTCQICSLSTSDEKNLLLEIDHIHPLSKGGITSEENLQTLCWRCNRSKGSRVIQ